MAKGATFPKTKTQVTGATILADDINNEVDNILDNGDAAGWGSAIATTAEHNGTSDPYSGSANQIPVSQEKLNQQFAYMIKQISGKSNPWVDAAAIGSKGADVASATDLVLGTDGNYFDCTGAIAITSIGSLGIGSIVRLHFDGSLVFTHHATNLILPGGANITTQAGDEAILVEYASGDWRCISYQRYLSDSFQTLANDATPSVAGGKLWLTGGTTTITDFDDGVVGQKIIIIAEHNITITDGTPIILNGGANFVMGSTDTLSLIQKFNGVWFEIGRSDNT